MARPSPTASFSGRLTLLKHYLLLATRGLRAQPGYLIVNTVGLGLGLALCLLVLTLVYDHVRADTFHAHADRIERVIADRVLATGETNGNAATPAYLGPAIERDVPGVEATVRLTALETLASRDGQSRQVRGLFAEPAFFDVFSFGLERTSVRRVLTAPHTAVLAAETAERLFGPQDPLGQVLTLDGVGEVTVVGIAAPQTLRSHLRFDVLVSFATLHTLPHRSAALADETNFRDVATYVLFEEGAPRERLSAYLAAQSEQRHEEAQVSWQLRLQPLSTISVGPILHNEVAGYPLPFAGVLLLGAVGLVVLLAAAFNYVGLTTARTLMRGREVGVRKTMGAHRSQLVIQLLVESVLVTLLALGVAALITPTLVRAFNGLALVQTFDDLQLAIDGTVTPGLVGLAVLLSVGVGLLAGLYPALHLSRFEPVRVLKGGRQRDGRPAMRLRKGLVVTQLVFSLLFAITALVLHRQATHLLDADYDFSTTDVLTMDLQGADYETLRTELLRSPAIEHVAATSGLPVLDGYYLTTMARSGQADTLYGGAYSAEPRLVHALGLDLLAATPALADAATPEGPGLILNEAALRGLGFTRPDVALGEAVWTRTSGTALPVVGVVRDFQAGSALSPARPLALYHDPSQFAKVAIHVRPGAMEEAEAHLEAVWAQVDPVRALAAQPYDEALRTMDVNRVLGDLVKVIGFVSVLALAIACLGLLSMAAFAARTRRKEVSIRKVLGAGSGRLVWLLSREYLVLMLAAALVGVPMAWLGNALWLQEFAQRITLGGPVILGGTLLVLGLGLLATLSQTARAVLSDPVEALRGE